ncbi:MAG: DMT family transporter [Candidatus Eiseniibacteriota bacterium]
MTLRSAWLAAMPGLFVVLWSSGYVFGKLGLPYAGPATFLTLRFCIVVALMLPVALITRSDWPRSWRAFGHIVAAGLMVQAVYLGSIFAAIHFGVPAGLAALIVGIQPLLTAALVGPMLGERVTPRQWLGFVLGLVGVALVVEHKLSFEGAELEGFLFCLLGLASITLGTIYQKRFGGSMDLRSTSVIQFGASAVVMAAIAYAFEDMHIDWTLDFAIALAWLCVVLSIGAITLLFLLIRQGAAGKVASLFYLVPPVTALMAWPMFGETLGLVGILGMAVAAVGVALVNR